MMCAEVVVELPNEQATLALGATVAKALQPKTRIYLSGDLGAGKTTLVRGLLRGLGYQGPVKSPTYTLVEVYALSRLDLHHFDFYRFNNSDEWNDAGFREVFDSDSVCLVEWPEKAHPKLPSPDLWIRIEHLAEGRRVRLSAHTTTGKALQSQLVPMRQ